MQDGKDVSNLPPSERDFGIVFQSYALFPNLTIEKNIAFGLENAGRSKSEITARVSELLELVGLPEQGKKYPAQLSGGQQQRVALARAIATNPGLLLLDEPFAAIDAQTTMDLMDVIHDCQKQGKTIITVIHDLALVNRFFPKVILLAKHLIGSGDTNLVMTGENLSKAGYQHIAYIPDPAPSIIKIETKVERNIKLNIKQPVNTPAICSNPEHYEENAS